MDLKLEEVQAMKFKYETMLSCFENDNCDEVSLFKKDLEMVVKALSELEIKLKI